MWCHVGYRYKDCKESKNVKHQNCNLNLRQCAADDGINEDADHHDGPEQQRSMPSLRYITGVVQGRETLDHNARKIGARGNYRLPGKDGEPTFSSQPGSTHL